MDDKEVELEERKNADQISIAASYASSSFEEGQLDWDKVESILSSWG